MKGAGRSTCVSERPLHMAEYENYTSKTFFITVQIKNLENMGIEPKFEKPDTLEEEYIEAIAGLNCKTYNTICISAKGLYHIHTVATFQQAMRRKAVAKLFGNAHIEDMQGTKEQAIDYIEKKGKWEEKGERVLRIFGNKEEIKDNTGRRSDLREFDKIAMSEDFNMNRYIIENGISEKKAKELESRYLRLLELNTPDWRELKVIYVEGKAGQGKTREAFKRYPKAYRADVSERTSFPFNGYTGQKVLILDELRPGIFSHAELMGILDGYPLNVNIKYGKTVARWETVVITTAMPLEEWYKDRQDIIGQDNRREQFRRRIKEHYIAKNGIWEEYKEEIPEDVQKAKEQIEENIQYFLDLEDFTEVPFI